MIDITGKKFTDREIKARVLYKLRKKRCWGGKYKPYISVVSWLEAKVRKNGKRVKKVVDRLVKNRYLLARKGGEVLSLNTRKKGKIKRIIDKELDKDRDSGVDLR